MRYRIHLSPPDVGEGERAMLLEAFDSGWIAPVGPHVDAFEREMCERLDVQRAVALASGTAGLHLALRIMGAGPGDEVLVASLTFAATANAVVYTGASPVFVDSAPDTWTVDPVLVAEAIEDCVRRTGRPPRALIAVDLYGQCADYDELTRICDAQGVPIIEDAAEALGATYRGRPAGTLGRVGILSFNGNKIITTSGGGMLLSREHSIADRALYLATQAREKVVHYEHKEVGHNYRLSNLLAAVGRAQLRGLDDKVAARRAHNDGYRRGLSHLDGFELMAEAPYGTSTFWLTCATIDAEKLGADRDEIRQRLHSRGIEARPVWKPMHLQPAYEGCRVVGGAVSEDLFLRGICLPSGSSMTATERDGVIEEIAELLEERR